MSELDYTPPRDTEEFLYYWNIFIVDVKERENLKQSHLLQLRMLCDLWVEHDVLVEEIEENGRTYKSEGRNGTQIKTAPEVTQLARVVSEIRNYSKMLGILLVKDTKLNEEEDANEFN